MKTEELKNLSIEELKEKIETTKTIFSVAIGVLIFSIAFALYNFIVKGQLDVVIITSFAMVLLAWELSKRLKNMQKELTTR